MLSAVYVLPFAIVIGTSLVYSGGHALRALLRSSPKERKKVDRQIVKLIEKLKAKEPPSK
jgi:hypothetical protein